MKKLLLFITTLCTTSVQSLGITKDTLAPCNGAWNCAITQEVDGQKPNAQPIHYAGSRTKAFAQLKATVLSFDHVTLVSEAANYLHVTFTTKLFGFVDDVEFFMPKDTKVIHIRSKSRTGLYDFGVNKRRVHAIIERFKEDN